MFERLAGGGDHDVRRDRFDATDLVAVTMLGWKLRPKQPFGSSERARRASPIS